MVSSRKHSLPRLILLGCGYLGRAVAESAVSRGWAVEALTRNPRTAAKLREELGIQVLESELASDAWHAAMDPQGAWIIDCVSSGGGGVSGYETSYRGGAESIVRWLRARGTAVGLIYTGSTSVYPQSGGESVNEDSPTGGTTPLNAVLLETEEIFRQAVAEGLLPRVAIVRLAGIYGPGRHYLIDRLRAGENEFAGRGDCFLNLIHRDDAANALAGLVGRWDGAGIEVFNCSDGQPALKEEVAQWTAVKLGAPAPVFHPGRASERLKRRLPAGGAVPHRRIEADKLRRATGWSPQYRDFREGYTGLLNTS